MGVTNDQYTKAVGLRVIMIKSYDVQDTILQQAVNIETTKRAWEEWTGMVGIGAAPEKTKGADFSEQNIFVEVPKRVAMTTYGVAVRLAYEDVEDDLYNVVKRLASSVGRSHKIVEEINRANLTLNGGFGTFFRTGYDGKALYATDHPLQGGRLTWSPATTNLTSALPTRSTATWSNKLATDADLDYASLLDARVLLMRTVTREGDFTTLVPKRLLIPPELEALSWEILNSSGRPDTANNTGNRTRNLGITPVVSPYYFDTDAWAVQADEHDLMFFQRQIMKTRMRDAAGNWDWVIESASRHGVGFHDPRGQVASPGM